MNKPLSRCLSVLGAMIFVVLMAGCATPVPAPDYAAIIGAKDRTDADRKNDVRRKPEQLLAFTGVRPGMKVLDMGAGAGYSTELLSRAVAPNGTVYSQTPPGLFEGANKAYMARVLNLAVKNAVRVERPFEDPLPPGTGGLDLVTFFFFYHDTAWLGVDRARMNRSLYEALKPGGVLVLADHSARAGAGDTVAQSLHRIEESVVRRELEAAGFRFEADAAFLRNPADTRDTNVNKNTVPNDEFVLKFRKPQ